MYSKKTVNYWAKKAGFIQRCRKVCAYDFLVLMTFGQLGMKAPSLAGMVNAIPANISRESLHYKYTKESVDFMKECFSFALKQKLQQKEQLDIELLNQFSNIYISDSSGWGVNPALKHILPGSGGSASDAACKIQTTYEYKTGAMAFCEVTEGTKNDQGYSCQLTEHLQAGDLSLEDLGYFSLKKFKQTEVKQAFYISRLLTSTTLFNPDNMDKIELRNILRNCKEDNYQAEVIMGAGKTKVACRLIAQRVPEQEANKRRRALRQGAKKRGRTPTKESLDYCDWLLLITNIPESMLPSQKVWMLYRIRWQIELLFKQLKSQLGIHKSNTKNIHRLRCELYGKLIVAVLIHHVHGFINSKLWKKIRRELSFDKLWKRIQERAFNVMKLLYISIKQATCYLQNEIRSAIPNCLKLKQTSRPTSVERLLIDTNTCFETLIL